MTPARVGCVGSSMAAGCVDRDLRGLPGLERAPGGRHRRSVRARPRCSTGDLGTAVRAVRLESWTATRSAASCGTSSVAETTSRTTGSSRSRCGLRSHRVRRGRSPPEFLDTVTRTGPSPLVPGADLPGCCEHADRDDGPRPGPDKTCWPSSRAGARREDRHCGTGRRLRVEFVAPLTRARVSEGYTPSPTRAGDKLAPPRGRDVVMSAAVGQGPGSSAPTTGWSRAGPRPFGSTACRAGRSVSSSALRQGLGAGPCPPVLGGACLGILAPVLLGTDAAKQRRNAELQVPCPRTCRSPSGGAAGRWWPPPAATCCRAAFPPPP